MPSRGLWLAGLAIIAIGAPSVRAQVPGLPATPGGAAGPAAAGAGAVPGLAGAAGSAGSAVPQASGLCANLGACLQRCRARLCASQFGQMLNSGITGPIGSLTGGFIPSICPPPSAAQAAALAAAQPGSAAATAAAIQASEAGAAARVAAIEYLGTVDCSRWPEARKALINGLRQDPNECVRFAAARALNSGCCCDKTVIAALRVCVAGEDSDGAPAENSFRVKAAAFSALQNCLMRVPEDLPPEPKPPVPEGERPQPLVPLPPTPERRTQRPAANPHIAAAYNPPRRGPLTYDEQLQHKTFSQTADEARRTLFEASRTPRPPALVPSGQRSLFGALSRARQEVGAANLRRAREQGLVPPRPDQSPAPLPSEPGAFAPDSGTAAGVMPPATPARAPGPVGDGMVADPGPISGTEPAQAPRSTARRGLVGMLFQPRGD